MSDDLEAINRIGPVFFDSYFVVDKERRITAHNAVFEQLLGLRPAQRRAIDGTHCFELLKLEICKEQCIAVECLKKNAPVRKEEIKGKTSTGRDLVVEISAIPLRDDAGVVVGVFVTHRDVTDERRLKTRFGELQAQTMTQEAELVQLRARKP